MSPEELKVGQFIVITGVLPQAEDEDGRDDAERGYGEQGYGMMMFGFGYGRRRQPTYEEVAAPHMIKWIGMPMKVLAVATPFLCVTDGKNRLSLDLRLVQVQVVSKKFFDEMTADVPTPAVSKEQRWRRKRVVAAGRISITCPRCGADCVQRSTGNGWRWVCKECDLQGPIMSEVVK